MSLEKSYYSWAATSWACNVTLGGSDWCVKWKNDTGETRQITSLSANMATVDGYCHSSKNGSSATGDGQPIRLRVAAYFDGSVKGYSDYKTITKKCGTHQYTDEYGTGYTSNVSSEYEKITWNFDSIEVPANKEVLFYFQNGTGGTVVGLHFTGLTDEDILPPTVYYTVTFDLDGGTRTGGGALSQSVEKGKYATAPTCTKTGYTFSGWDKSLGPITANTTIKALWTAKVTLSFDAMGGSGAPASVTVDKHSTVTISSTKPKKSVTLTYNPNDGTVSPTSKSVSLTFRGWSKNEDRAVAGTIDYNPGDSILLTSNTVLYASWGPGAVGTLPTPTRSSEYKFDKWTTTLNGSTQVTAQTTISKNTTIYAKWQYRVLLKGNGGTIYDADTGESSTSVTCWKSHGTSFTIPDYLVTYSDDGSSGRVFKGYGTSSTATTVSYNVGSNYTTNSPITLYAVYTVNKYTVTFDLNGGTSSGGGALVQQVEHGHDAVPPNNPTKQGKTFSGWFGNYKNVTSNRKIKAMWGGTPIWIMSSDHTWVKYQPTEG